MKAKKKNRFLTFCCSFMPGAGEMYMGFMKMGVSLMSLFLLSVAGLSILRFDEFAVSVGVVIWCYGFFHANHLTALNEEEFAQVTDGFWFGEDILLGGKGWVQRYQKVIAGLLIASGIILLWNTATDIARNFLPEYVWEIMRTVGNYVPRVMVACLIIVIGIKLICGRKAQLAQPMQIETEVVQNDAEVQSAVREQSAEEMQHVETVQNAVEEKHE